MIKRTESFFNSFDGTKIFFQYWEKPEYVGTVIITHGQGEHSDAYLRLIEGLQDSPWNFLAWDLRGHGRSEGQRGYASRFDDFTRDFSGLLTHIQDRPQLKNKKTIFLAHSMGGLIQLKTQFLFGLPPHEAQVLSAPLLGLSVAVPLIKDLGAVVMNQVFPRLTLSNEIRYANLTRDPDVILEFERDAFRHGKISSGVYLGMLESFPFVQEKAAEFKSPFLLQMSDNDPIVSSPAALKFFDAAGSPLKFKNIYHDGMHESYNDIHRATVYQDLKEFLKKFES